MNAPTHRKTRTLAWPGNPSDLTPETLDLEALAHVLGHTCRWGGRTRTYHSLAHHAVVASETVEGLDGMDAPERRALALHALITPARAAWLGDAAPASAKAAEAIDRAVRAAVGLAPELPPTWAETLRFVERMTDAAERRDIEGVPPDPGPAFLPLKRRIRPVRPAHAVRLWLARLDALTAPPGDAATTAPATESPQKEAHDVAHLPAHHSGETRDAA